LVARSSQGVAAIQLKVSMIVATEAPTVTTAIAASYWINGFMIALSDESR